MINVLVAPYKSIEVETEEDGNQILSEGQKITFVTEGDGIVKKVLLLDLKDRSPKKLKLK